VDDIGGVTLNTRVAWGKTVNDAVVVPEEPLMVTDSAVALYVTFSTVVSVT
jgi:hypothetical protein